LHLHKIYGYGIVLLEILKDILSQTRVGKPALSFCTHEFCNHMYTIYIFTRVEEPWKRRDHMSKVSEVVENIVTPIVNEIGLELVDIEYVKEGRDWFLRVYIDKENGVDIEDCGIVSEKLSEKLDAIDPIPHNYFLEVSSPGAERPLKKDKDFEKAMGKNVFIKTYEPIDGEKAFEGILTQFDGETVTVEVKIKTRKKSVVIPYDKVANARLAVTF
jgi:ribosome maturation factor RimP